jgi:hypothetical protein
MLRYASGECVLASAAGGCGCGDDANPCTLEFCADGECVHPQAYAGSGCPGGTCYGTQCCTGCWDGAACRSGTEVTACGTYGEPCYACLPADCSQVTCLGSCEHEPLNGPDCPHCGALDESCCAGAICEAGLACANVLVAEDLFKQLCQSP